MEEKFSEGEITDRIVELKDHYHLGFRRIGQKLSMEGYRISKDKAWRLYRKRKALKPSSIVEDKEFGELKDREERARKSFELLKDKNQLRRSIATYGTQKLMEDYDGRRRIFTEKDRLLKFARRTLKVTDPTIWSKFSEYCEMHGFDLARTLLGVLGPQEYFDEQLGSNEKVSLDVYIASRMRRYLSELENLAEEYDSPSEQTTSEENETDEYLDDEGYWHITLPSNDEYE